MNTQTMTLNQIAGIIGKGERTIRRWIHSPSDKMTGSSEIMSGLRSKISEAEKTKKPAAFTLEETIEIIKAGGNENLANLLMQNAQSSQQTAIGSSLTSKDIDLISAIVSKTIAATTELLSGRVQNIETAFEKRKALLPAPDIKPRDAINKLVRDFATRTEMQYNSVWNKIYTEFNYTYNVSVRVSATNRNMTIIDYIETEGMIEQLLSVAVKVLGD